MTTYAPPTSLDVGSGDREDTARISRVPYLAGLDGMRALAVIAVMVYHANSSWLPGGFLGVEMFFVISGYLITLLIIAERERTYRVSLIDFWKRRARRLLPALYVLLIGVTAYTAVFEPAALGHLRGDVIAGVTYSSNWYQLFVGLGYTAAFDFAPLRHLWSLAVEEQFYVVWPLVMVALLGRKGTRRVADVSRWLFFAAVVIAIIMALLYHPGVIGEPNETPDAYWFIGDHAISKLDFLYIGTFSRASGVLLGAAFAMVWRPFAVRRGPLRSKGVAFDVAALVALIGFSWMCWNLYLVTPSGEADGRLFRGGLFLSSVLTLVVIAAVCHPGARANRVLGNSTLRWIGLRSYGLYLFHWPVYQAIREVAGKKLTVSEFVLAMVITVIITELSYRFVETPIRTGQARRSVRRFRRRASPFRRRVVVSFAAIGVVTTLVTGVALATADLEENEITQTFEDNEESTVDLGASDIDELSLDGVDDSDTDVTAITSEPDSDGEPDAEVFTPNLSPDIDDDSPPRQTPTDSAPPTSSAPTTEPSATIPPIVSAGLVTDASQIVPLDVPGQGPAPQLRLIGFGDSVMLGSAEELTARGFVVDAVQSRQFTAALPQLQSIKDNGLLGSAVVVHLGTNGSFSQSSLKEMMDILEDVPVVVFLTGKADRVWIPGNNELIRALPTFYDNVTVLDWAVLGPQCGAGCFYADDIHLDAKGQDYYAGLISLLLGL